MLLGSQSIQALATFDSIRQRPLQIKRPTQSALWQQTVPVIQLNRRLHSTELICLSCRASTHLQILPQTKIPFLARTQLRIRAQHQHPQPQALYRVVPHSLRHRPVGRSTWTHQLTSSSQHVLAVSSPKPSAENCPFPPVRQKSSRYANLPTMALKLN